VVAGLSLRDEQAKTKAETIKARAKISLNWVGYCLDKKSRRFPESLNEWLYRLATGHSLK
jgi:hypothetical protein